VVWVAVCVVDRCSSL